MFVAQTVTIDEQKVCPQSVGVVKIFYDSDSSG